MLTRPTSLACLLVACIASLAGAAPSIVVSPLGPTPAGNRLWNFQIVPDFDLAPSGTPLAIELAFAIDHTDLIAVDVNTAVWDFANPGHNPFTGTITDGLWIDLIGDRTFGAYGSMIITTPGPVDLFRIETAGTGLTALRYGTAASGHPSQGARIAQLIGDTGGNFDEHTGTITFFDGISGAVAVPEPATTLSGAAALLALTAAARRRRSVKPKRPLQRVAPGLP